MCFQYQKILILRSNNMIYKKFKDLELSALGMGCMRLPTFEDGTVNVEATAEMVDYAIGKGVNYFDTAWVYHGGKSETIMGEILEKYPRDSFYLATKFPGFSAETWDKVEEIFEEQLKKCRVDYFDFYLFHNVSEHNIDAYLDDEKYGIHSYLVEQKKKGRIRHLGFSAHGNMNTLKRFLSAYGRDMEFCQLQINYIDWHFQNAVGKIELMKEYGIPVWVMEPLRGGKLVKLDEKYEKMLRALRPTESNHGFAFRFLQSVPEIVMTLSGMSNIDQIKDNIDIYSTEEPLSDAERKTLFEIADELVSPNRLPCTACRYCTEYCPQELDIPTIIELYNDSRYSKGTYIVPSGINELDEDKRPSSCIACRACETVCPQNIKISEMMSDFSKRLK